MNRLIQLKDKDGNKIYPKTRVLTETELYDDEDGTTDEVELSDDVANYKYLEIYYRINDSTIYQGSTKVYNPNGKYTFLVYPLVNAAGNTVYYNAKQIYIANKSIINAGTRQVQLTLRASPAVTAKANYIYITRVVGYKY